jgi:hypothetical protein
MRGCSQRSPVSTNSRPTLPASHDTTKASTVAATGQKRRCGYAPSCVQTRPSAHGIVWCEHTRNAGYYQPYEVHILCMLRYNLICRMPYSRFFLSVLLTSGFFQHKPLRYRLRANVPLPSSAVCGPIALSSWTDRLCTVCFEEAFR